MATPNAKQNIMIIKTVGPEENGRQFSGISKCGVVETSSSCISLNNPNWRPLDAIGLNSDLLQKKGLRKKHAINYNQKQ